MKAKYGHSLKRTLAFVAALTILTSSAIVTSFAADKTEKTAAVGTVAKHVDDYTKVFPGITATKLKLSDPVFTEKDWYEYIEYEPYTEVKDGDITYRIYQPTDYSAASIMAITDYNPKEVLGGTNSITMNLGELQGILDIAAQGGNFSKEYAGLTLASGIATQMNGVNDIMDNSKYYSSSSFLGIPGDKKFTGVSNDGFFNASSLEIEITESETVTACKTVAIDSNYTISDLTENGKSTAKRVEVYNAESNTDEEQNYSETSKESGKITFGGQNTTTDTYDLITDITNEMKKDVASSHNTETEAYDDLGWSGEGPVAVFHIGGKEGNGTQDVINYVPTKEDQHGTVTSVEVFESDEDHDLTTKTDGETIVKSKTVEHAMTNGDEEEKTYQHANEMAVGVGYGVDYQYGNEHSLAVGVKRIFNAREEKEVKNVGWKLCEYIVKIPYYVEVVKTDSTTGEEKVLYGQYVNYNLLNGISRVFANGYIEHWYTGELVTYADFFNGFITAQELVDKAKEQQAAKVPKEGE